ARGGAVGRGGPAGGGLPRRQCSPPSPAAPAGAACPGARDACRHGELVPCLFGALPGTRGLRGGRRLGSPAPGARAGVLARAGSAGGRLLFPTRSRPPPGGRVVPAPF